eukprot:211524-Amphidinium_carterae.1
MVRLPEPESVEVVPVMETNLPAAPFVIGPHQRVVEHATYAICLDYNRHVGLHTGRKNFHHHVLKGAGGHCSLPDSCTSMGQKVLGFNKGSCATQLQLKLELTWVF